MGSGHIRKLPFSPDRSLAREQHAHQLDLFRQDAFAGPKIVIFDPSRYDEESFVRAVNRNSVKLIFDIRARPVFEKPNYSHKRLTSYFFEHHINYIDIAHLLHSSDNNLKDIENFFKKRLGRASGSEDFFGFLLIDQRARDQGVVAEVRAAIRIKVSQIVEVHPNSVGL